MSEQLRSLLIIADIEGSSGCWSYGGSSFMTDEWCRACVDMARDVNAVVTALFDAGVRKVTVQDFHRTAYNLLPELIDPRAQLRSGYRQGPVPGIGDPGDAQAVMFLGMHSASGTEGFLAHTLTSRIKRLEVSGRPLAEVELFSASLAPFGLRPIFFSGCPIACAQARQAIKGIACYTINKTVGPEEFDPCSWRSGLGGAAVEALNNVTTRPYSPEGPFKTVVTMRNGEEQCRRMARRWGFDHEGADIFLEASDMHKLYNDLVKLCFFTPFVQKTLPFALICHRLVGYLGLQVVRLRRKGAHVTGPGG
jgi:D-aminopeptidase